MMAGFKDRLDTVEETSGDSKKKKKVLSTVKGEREMGQMGSKLWGMRDRALRVNDKQEVSRTSAFIAR